MRLLIQRVKEASVTINQKVHAHIGTGLLVLVGIEHEDQLEDIVWLSSKLISLRIMPDKHGVMNLSIKDTGGELLVVSQFTLHASTKKGNRPSYIRAARPEQAQPMFNQFVSMLTEALGKTIETGVFGADMQVALVNDGPVTIWIDSKERA